MIGTTVSHYRLIEKLGGGGMGVVYKAEDTRLKRTVALKFLPPELTRDEGAKERFIHEAQAASALQHNNICAVHDIDETADGQLFIVMDCYEGETLKEKIERGPVKIEEATDFAIQVAQGLAEAHAHDIIHRDVKPANILITKGHIAKIVDFGLAKLSGATKLTKTGTTLGTIAYMSPEQLQGCEVDVRADIFSLGVVLYEMLSGKPPFLGDHEAALMYSIVNEEPQPIQNYVPDVSSEIVHVVGRALEKNPADRYQTAQDMLIDLRRMKKDTTRVSGIARIQSGRPLRRWLSKKALWFESVAVFALIATLLILNPFGLLPRTEKQPTSTNTLAVMYFENIPDPQDKDHTAEMLTSLMTTSLSQTQGLDVISRDRLFDIQAEFGQQGTRKITPAMVSEIAQRVGAAKVLTGTVIQLEPQMAITAQLVEAKSGKILGAQRLTGFGRPQIFALVESLTYLVRRDLQVEVGSSAESKSVAMVTTTSPEAYQAYVAAVDLKKRLSFEEAAVALKQAIELDTNFTMAYYQLSFLSGGEWALKKAWDLRGNVTEAQRLNIEAWYYRRIEKDVSKCIRTLEMLLQKYPHYQDVYGGLMWAYLELLEFEKSIQFALKGLRNDSLDKNLWGMLSSFYAYMNQKQEATDAVNHYLRLAPGEPNPYDIKGAILLQFGEVDSALYWYKKSNSFRKSFSANTLAYISLLRQEYQNAENYFHGLRTGGWGPDDAAEGDLAAAMILMHQGKLVTAREELMKYLSIHEAKGAGAVRDRQVLMNVSYELGDYKAMVQYAQKLSNIVLARAWLKNGNVARCDSLLGQITEDKLKGSVLWPEVTLHYIKALIWYEKGEYENCLRDFQKAFALQPPNRRPEYIYGVALVKSGRVSQAITELKRVTWWVPDPGLWQGYVFRDNYWLIAAVKAHYWLGAAYEEQGEKEKAIKEYGTFLDIWKGADFKSRELQDAKARLAKLKGIGSK